MKYDKEVWLFMDFPLFDFYLNYYSPIHNQYTPITAQNETVALEQREMKGYR